MDKVGVRDEAGSVDNSDAKLVTGLSDAGREKLIPSNDPSKIDTFRKLLPVHKNRSGYLVICGVTAHNWRLIFLYYSMYCFFLFILIACSFGIYQATPQQPKNIRAYVSMDYPNATIQNNRSSTKFITKYCYTASAPDNTIRFKVTLPDGHGTVNLDIKGKSAPNTFNWGSIGSTGTKNFTFSSVPDTVKVTLIDSSTSKTLDSFDFKFLPYESGAETCDYTNQITEE